MVRSRSFLLLVLEEARELCLELVWDGGREECREEGMLATRGEDLLLARELVLLRGVTPGVDGRTNSGYKYSELH